MSSDGQTVVEIEPEHIRALADDIIEILPVDSSGQRRVWRWSDREKILKGAADGDFVIQFNGGTPSVQLKDRIKEGRKPKTIWLDSKYDASSHGTNLLKSMLGERAVFGYPKSLHATRDALHTVVGDDPASTVVDLFGGSGTTAHATIELNRIDEGQRSYVLAEMGEYFDSVLKPRIQKAIYSEDWKDGKPVSREGSSHMFKYIRLESYEDTLNNLELRRTQAQQELLESADDFRRDYLLHYMLEVEAGGRTSRLDLEHFEDPFSYKLQISTGSAGETRPVEVDLVETFNYLLGLRVRHIDRIRGIRVVQGTSPEGERVLIIWRNTREVSSADLDAFFRKQDFNPRDAEFDVIYVNGDNNLENLRRPDETWKVRLIEEEFLSRMFDVRDV
jgi:adenine-specific DNA-methyltransferase